MTTRTAHFRIMSTPSSRARAMYGASSTPFLCLSVSFSLSLFLSLSLLLAYSRSLCSAGRRNRRTNDTPLTPSTFRVAHNFRGERYKFGFGIEHHGAVYAEVNL